MYIISPSAKYVYAANTVWKGIDIFNKEYFRLLIFCHLILVNFSYRFYCTAVIVSYKILVPT
jgi:hypothetical protein